MAAVNAANFFKTRGLILTTTGNLNLFQRMNQRKNKETDACYRPESVDLAEDIFGDTVIPKKLLDQLLA